MIRDAIIRAGASYSTAQSAILLLHGRGGTARDLLPIARQLGLDDFVQLAPAAPDHTWYPNRFTAPIYKNQPALDHSLTVLDRAMAELIQHGISSARTYILGFSQGACLALEYACLKAKRYGGIIAFTGGLMGDTLDNSRYAGNFLETPFLMTSGDSDPHIPLARFLESADQLRRMNAYLTIKVFPDRPHTVLNEEIELAGELIRKTFP